MAYFSDSPTKKLNLPSDNEYWVEVVERFRWKEIKAFVDVSNGGVDFSTTADKVLLSAIKSWNLDLDDGTVAPIDQDNIDKLSQQDVLFILNELNLEVDSSSKKNSSAK